MRYFTVLVLLTVFGCDSSSQQEIESTVDSDTGSLRFFQIESTSIAMGCPSMGLVPIEVSQEPGLYYFPAGALSKATGPKRDENIIDVDSMVVYVVDATRKGRFDKEYHRLANTVNYDMHKMSKLHAELEKRVGVRIGFYWLSDFFPGTEVLEEARYRVSKVVMKKAL